MSNIEMFFQTYIVPLGWKLMGAVAVWIIGGWVIKLASKALGTALSRRKVDATLARYAEGGANVALRVLLVIAVLGMLGIETTSFAALLAAAGIAIGAAWGGLLANFAAGVFLVFLRPFKVGDMITAGGVTGMVVEIGLFATTIDGADNVRVFVGNNTIFSSNIQNYTANPYRRVELTAQLPHNANPVDAIKSLKTKLASIPNVLATPAPEVDILTFNAGGPVLSVRPYCSNDNYWQVYFDANQAILALGAESGFGAPVQHVVLHNEK